MAVTESLVEAVAEKTAGDRVLVVRLEIGELSGIVPDALRFCFDVCADGTALAGARLEIAEPPGEAACRTCGGTFRPEHAILLCPCGSADVRIVGGEQLRVTSVEVAATERA